MLVAVLALACALLPTAVPALAADAVTLALKDHRFVPSEVSVRPASASASRSRTGCDAGRIREQRPARREDRRSGGKIAVMAGPLKPGIYKFFDDYHPDLANGTVTAVEHKD